MRIRPDVPARVVGLLTVAYSTAMTVSPKVLAGPTGQTDLTGRVPTAVAELTRSLGVRDVALAAALVAAPTGYPLSLLTVARVVSDGADAVWFGRLVDDRGQRAKISGVAAGWALLEAAAGVYAARGRAITLGR